MKHFLTSSLPWDGCYSTIAICILAGLIVFAIDRRQTRKNDQNKAQCAMVKDDE